MKRSRKPAPVRETMVRLGEAFASPPEANDRAPSAHDQAVRIVEALLFAGGEPVKAKDLAQRLPPGTDVATVLMDLKRTYAGRGIELVETGAGWRFQTARDLGHLFDERREAAKRLPKAALETLAVIAYHQPVTRAEMEEIRGVSLSRGTLDLLLEIGWVAPRGRRRSPGKPLTFGTTEAFLSHFGLQSLDALPARADLKAAGYADSRTDAAFDALRPGEPPSDDEAPLSDEGASFFVEFASGEE